MQKFDCVIVSVATCPKCNSEVSEIDAESALCEPCHNETSASLEYLRGEIEAERISYGEIAELESLAAYIDPSDTLLRQWAGIPESE